MTDSSNSLVKLPEVSVALIHWPVRDRTGSVVATNVTNFDIHDIARVAKTYGVHRYFIVHRQREQLMFVNRILEHWKVGYGAKYNPSRGPALESVQLAETLEEVISRFEVPPRIIGTAARVIEGLPRVSFGELKKQMSMPGESSYLLVFGTGYGLTSDLLKSCHAVLEPIKGASPEQFRHLSVRSAVSICLDRLLSTW